MINIEDNRKSPLCRSFGNEGKYQDLHICTRRQARQPIHMNDVLEIIYVHQGSARIRVSFDDYDVRRDEFMIINTFELHSVESLSEDTILSSIRIGPNYYNYVEGLIVWWTEELHALEEYKQLARQIRDLVHLYHRDAPAGTMEQALRRIVEDMMATLRLEIFGDLVYHSKKPTYDSAIQMERMNKLYMYLYTHYDEKITLDMLCRELYLSKYYLSRYFRKTMGGTLSNTLGLIRSEKAEILLLGSGKPLSIIAAECGFSSAHYFNATFLKVFGMTPNEYRRHYRSQIIGYTDFTGEIIGTAQQDAADPQDPRSSEEPDAKAGARLLIELPGGTHRVTVIDEEDPSNHSESQQIRPGELVRLRFDEGDKLLLIRGE